jgi:hypothetical protein
MREVSFSPIIRATTSVDPPAEKGTISLIGFAGHGCACEVKTDNNPAAAAAARTRKRLLISNPPLENALKSSTS